MDGKKSTYLLASAKKFNLIERKVSAGNPLDAEEGLCLYQHAELGYLARLAHLVRTRKNGMRVYYNRNFHLEPTNICIHNCLFCSYRKRAHEPDAWEMDVEQILSEIDRFSSKQVTEVHMVGGVHPKRGLEYYENLIQKIRNRRPELFIKAFTAVELDYMFRKSAVSVEEGLRRLKMAGLDAIPGGGAEIFDEELRRKICPDKTDGATWLAIHESAHQLGIPTNATMLYGHLESYEQRIDHMERIRSLQQRSGGFQVFIPLKYRKENNSMTEIGEVSAIEDLKNYAVCRIFLDNIPHIKAYWPMIGREMASLALSFGVDDLDGTIEDTTRIYSMAGADDQNPAMSAAELSHLILQAGFTPVERDTLYNHLKTI